MSVPSVARTLSRSLLQALRGLRSGPGTLRFIEAFNPSQEWGRGRKLKRAQQVELLKMALPPWVLDSGDCLKIAENSGVVENGLELLDEKKVQDLVRVAIAEGANLQEGFESLRMLQHQCWLHKSTSMETTQGLVRVEGTSIEVEIPAVEGPAFCYRISIENVGKNPVKLEGRHWKIFDTQKDEKILLHEIDKGSVGVVGLQPIINPGERFVYASGTELKSGQGQIEGSFQMVEMVDGSKRGFDATVAPIPFRKFKE
ncbi:hypothetical protein AAMO2058_000920100 [Amorphochlora amoebiformis]